MHPTAQTPGFWISEIAAAISFGILVGSVALLAIGFSS